LAACLLVGSTVGAQLGAAMTRRLRGVQIRHAFSYLVFATAFVVMAKLLAGLGMF
jgi:uncharacterized membrane protein YfcA